MAKQCKGCGEIKQLSEYNTHPKSRDGREGKCRVCRNSRFKINYIRAHPNDPRRHLLTPEPPQKKEAKPYKVTDPWFIFD